MNDPTRFSSSAPVPLIRNKTISLAAQNSSQQAATPPPLDVNFIYQTFIGGNNGTGGLNGANAEYQQILKLGILVQDCEKLDSKITDALMNAAKSTFYQNGSIDIQQGSIGIDINKITVSVPHVTKQPNGTYYYDGTNQSLTLPQAITFLNNLSAATQSFYKKLIEKNPSVATNPLLQGINFPDPITIPSISSPETGMSASETQDLINQLSSFSSNYINLQKYIALVSSSKQQNINNAYQALTSTLKLLVSTLLSIIHNIS